MNHRILLCLMPLLLGAKTPAPLPWEEAARRVLEAYDAGNPLPKAPDLPTNPGDGPHLRWLEAAAANPIPANPYPPRTQNWKEAEAIRHFLGKPGDLKALGTLPLTLEGSRMALWRWGQLRVRAGRLSPKDRRAWEDRLRMGPEDLLQTYATRHALCFCLAEGDRARFQAILETAPGSYQEVLQMFQRTFALIDGPCPPLRLWRLSDLTPVEEPLNTLGPQGIWIAPLEDFPDPPPPGWVWVLPTPGGSQSPREGTLEEASRVEGAVIAGKMKGSGRVAYLAPSAGELEALFPSFFPIRVEFGKDGTILRIFVGDAARAKGTDGKAN